MNGGDGGSDTSLPNVIMFGGAITNKYAAALAKIQPFESIKGTGTGDRSGGIGAFEYGGLWDRPLSMAWRRR